MESQRFYITAQQPGTVDCSLTVPAAQAAQVVLTQPTPLTLTFVAQPIGITVSPSWESQLMHAHCLSPGIAQAQFSC